MNHAKRDYIIHRINDVLSASKCGVGMPKILDQFELQTIEMLITDSHLVYTCTCCKDVIEHIATEIADFTDRAKEYLTINNPLERERNAIVQYQNYSQEEFAQNWIRLHKALSSKYPKELLDADFYADEFAKHHYQSRAYLIAREELLQDWGRQLRIREIDFELHLLSALRKKFESDLREKLTLFRSLITQRQLNKVQIGLFWSLERGQWRQKAFDILATYATLFYKNSSIEILLAELGRYGACGNEQVVNRQNVVGCRRFSRAQKSDIYGITQSDDLNSLLPLEVAMLSEPKLENNFYKRFTEKKLQTFSYQSHTKEYVESDRKYVKTQEHKHGPFIVCIDTSASMCGTAEQLAKTICYGLILKSRQQNRHCFVITFSTAFELFDISDVKNNSKAIIDFLMHSFSGGTNLNLVFNKVIEMLSNKLYRNADVLFISDFIAPNLRPNLVAAISEEKSRNTRFHALLIGDFYKGKLLSHFNMVWKYDSERGEITHCSANIKKESTKG